jgi:hypothetical protein
MQGKESIQGRLFNAERSGSNIKITNVSDGKELATIYPNNQIAMTQALSRQQVQALDTFQTSVAAEKAAAKNIKREGPSLGLG